MIRIFYCDSGQHSFRVYYTHGGLYVHLLDIIRYLDISKYEAEEHIVNNPAYDKIQVNGITLYNVSTIKVRCFLEWCYNILTKIRKKYNNIIAIDDWYFVIKDYKICLEDDGVFMKSNIYDNYLLSGIRNITKDIEDDKEKIYSTFKYVCADFESKSDLDMKVSEWIFGDKISVSWKIFRYLIKKDIKRFRLISMEHCFDIIQGNIVIIKNERFRKDDI